MMKSIQLLASLFLVGISSINAQPPTISTIAPLSGAVGAVITITGTNFDTAIAKNMVFFGTMRAVVNTASATSLTVTVPTGATYASITVLNATTNLAVCSNNNFSSTYSPSKNKIEADDFAAKQDFSQTNPIYSMASGDLDGDGKTDIAVWEHTIGIKILRNTGSAGTISFAAPITVSLNVQAVYTMAIADVDGDGKMDIVCLDYWGSTFCVLRNTGSIGAISFAAPQFFATSSSPTSLVIGDIDSDGKPEIVVGGFYANPITFVYRNTGSSGAISFAAPVTIASVSGTMAIGDLDIDGKPDLAIANSNGNSLSVLRNTGSAGTVSFAAVQNFTTTYTLQSIVVGDLDGDSKPDLAAAAGLNTTSIPVYRNTSSIGTISFTRQDFTTGPSPQNIAMGDIDGDGRPDLMASCQNPTFVTVLRNTGNSGTVNFSSNINLAAIPYYGNPLLADADMDGKTDLIMLRNNVISVFRNNPVFSPNLSSLTLSTGSLYPNLTTATTAYTVAVPNTTSAITVTPVPEEASSIIETRINGGSYTTVASGNASPLYTLNAGANTIEVKVSPAYNSPTRTYTITVVRTEMTDLSALTITSGILAPLFTPLTTSYAAIVNNSQTTVTPAVANAGATIEVRVNGGSYTNVANNTASSLLPLNYGSNAIDVKVTSQDGNTVKTYSITATRLSPPGNALRFDNSNDYVSLPTALATAATSASNNAITIEYWYKGPSLQSAVRFQGATGGFIIAGYNNTHVISTDGSVAEGMAVGTAAIDGNWHHIAMTWQRNSVNGFKSYLDGQLVEQRNSADVALPAISAAPLLGSYLGTSEYTNGSLDEVRIYNTALTQANIQSDMLNTSISVPANLLAYYNFDAGIASSTNSYTSTLTDQSSNGYHGTLNNFALTGTTSNWIESYAMVVPTALAATNLQGNGFIANWTAPAVGVVENYLIDVSTDSSFATVVSGSPFSTAGTATNKAIIGLSPSTTYYYRVRANKTSVAGQGKNSNTISFTTSALLTPPGNALHFDGIDDYVSIPAYTPFNVSNITIEAWVFSTNYNKKMCIVEKGTTNSQYLLFFESNTGITNLYFRTVSSTSFNNELVANISTVLGMENGKWYHIAATFDGTTKNIYINGILKATQTNPHTILTNTTGLTIGSLYNQLYRFNGKIDELRIYNTALTQANIQADMASTSIAVPSSLVAYYNFDNGQAGTTNTGSTYLMDQSSNGSTGTLNNFALLADTSNWVESYAMVVPKAIAASDIAPASFTANWSTPLVGVVDEYLLDVSTDTNFTSYLSGYQALSVAGLSKSITGLTSNTAYYYRVRASKASVVGQATYSSTITAIPTLSSNANLSSLTTNAGAISPAFAAATIAYNASVNASITNVTVTPTVADSNATIQVRINVGAYNTLISGNTSNALNLVLGSNTIDIKVTAQDGSTKTYSLTIMRFVPPGNALRFDGANDYVTLPSSLSTATGTDAITIEYWFKGSSYQSAVRFQGAAGFIIAGWGSTSTHIISTDGYTNGGIAVGAAATDGNWHHIAMTWQRNTVNGFKSYLDGNLVAQRNSADVSLPLITENPYLGCYNTIDEFTNGSLDEVRIYNAALTQANIKLDMLGVASAMPANLLAYYDFDNGVPAANNTAATNLMDKTVNGHNGMLNNFALTGSTSNWITSTIWNTWLGTTNQDWAVATNWHLGIVPYNTDHVIVPTGAANLPVTINGTRAAKNISIQTGASLNIAGTLEIADGLYNNGTIDATSGTIELNGPTTQTINANAAIVRNMILINPAGASMVSQLNITGTLTLTSGLLNTGGFLTLKSDANGTGRIGAISTGGISGNVTLERYIPAKTARTYSLVASPFNQSINSSWQQQIHITGAGTGGTICPSLTAHTNGFDATISNAASMFVYDGSKTVGSRWTSVTGTNSINLSAGTGYRMNIRGPRATGCSLLNGTLNTVPAVTLSSTGSLSPANKNQGSISITLPNNGNTTAANDNYLLTGNPYPSQISFSAFLPLNNSVINNAYAIYAPGNTVGNYAFWNGSTFTGGNTGLDDATGDIIASGQAFFLQGKNAGADITLQWAEGMKTAAVTNGYFRQLNPNRLRIGYLLANGSKADEIMVQFTEKGTTTEMNSEDIVSINAGSQNLKSMKSGNTLAFNTRNIHFVNDTVQLNIASNSNGDFKLSFYDFDQFGQAHLVKIYLIDRFMGTTQLMNDNKEYPFTVSTANPATQGANRFAVAFSKPAPLQPIIPKASITVYPNPFMHQLTVELPVDQYSIKLMDILGKTVLSQNVVGTATISTNRLASGTYLLEIVNAGKEKTIQKIVKQ